MKHFIELKPLSIGGEKNVPDYIPKPIPGPAPKILLISMFWLYKYEYFLVILNIFNIEV